MTARGRSSQDTGQCEPGAAGGHRVTTRSEAGQQERRAEKALLHREARLGHCGRARSPGPAGPQAGEALWAEASQGSHEGQRRPQSRPSCLRTARTTARHAARPGASAATLRATRAAPPAQCARLARSSPCHKLAVKITLRGCIPNSPVRWVKRAPF